MRDLTILDASFLGPHTIHDTKLKVGDAPKMIGIFPHQQWTVQTN